MVHGRYASRPLELAVALTGVLATMPYIALQLIGMETIVHALGLKEEIPLAAAFLILAFYDYSSGLRAPALIAFIKDTIDLYCRPCRDRADPLKTRRLWRRVRGRRRGFQGKGAGGTQLSVRPWPCSCIRMR